MNVKEYINSNYKLVKSLKRDGSVMIARCTIDDALYVVKNKKAYDSEIYKRLKEADIDGIPKVYEVLEEKGGLWVIEEFVQGRTLEEFFGDEYLADVTGESGKVDVTGDSGKAADDKTSNSAATDGAGDSGKAADDKASNSTATDGAGDSGKVADDKASNSTASDGEAPGGAAADGELPDNVLEVSFDSTGINGIKTENDAAEWMLTNVIISVSKTLNKLHTLNPPIIHRDIKPENIIITDLAEIKLLDFNISRGFTGKADKDTVAMGTKGFAPPEQYGFKESDARSDIYSLGATIKYLMEKTHCKSEMLSEFIKKAMSFDPKDRFQNVIEVIYFIKHYDDDETEALLSQAGNAGLAGGAGLAGNGNGAYSAAGKNGASDSAMDESDKEKLRLEIENKRLELEQTKANNRIYAYALAVGAILVIILIIALS